MSADLEATADEVEVCASCGKAALDDVKLKKCACKLVKYCSVECQKNHRKQHEQECKLRLAELREDQLFKQPDESHLGECPICCLPLQLDRKKAKINSCCCQRICNGCSYANAKREWEQGLDYKCAYCREELPETDEEVNQNYMNRAKANDPAALSHMGSKCYDDGDFDGAVEYYKKAAQLGDIEAHYNLSISYRKGEGVEKDPNKEMHHLEEAAIGGHPCARYNIGVHEERGGRYERAMKHFIIAAKQGDDGALGIVKRDAHGIVSKEDCEAALCGHQATVDAAKSHQRDEAYAFYNLSPEEQERRWLESLGH